MAVQKYDEHYFRCHRYDSVTGKHKKVVMYKELSKCLLYAKRSKDDVTIRNSDNEILWTFKMGELDLTQAKVLPSCQR